ncbi:MAG: hypothetical protein HWE10_01975 [Gammaproteobacteria bacterium]|nr:hypothetical protein [Gammaproteobacteria bacterium]
MHDIRNLIGCAMSLLSGQSASFSGQDDDHKLDPQSEQDLLLVAQAIDECLRSSDIKSEGQVIKLEHFKSTLKAIAPYGSRYISNRHDNYFIIQCAFDFDLLEDALEHESLDDMYDSMSIAHDIERDKFESSAIIVREINNNVQACDLRGCWSPLADKFAVRVEDWVDHYTI